MRCKTSMVIRVSGVVVSRCFAWNARASVSSNPFRWPCNTIGLFSRLDLQGSVEIILALQSRAGFPRAIRECQILISGQAQHFERFARRCNAIFRDRRSTVELCVQISWQVQHFRAFRARGRRSPFQLACRFRGRRSTLMGRVALAVVWCAFGDWVGRIALAVARCTF